MNSKNQREEALYKQLLKQLTRMGSLTHAISRRLLYVSIYHKLKSSNIGQDVKKLQKTYCYASEAQCKLKTTSLKNFGKNLNRLNDLRGVTILFRKLKQRKLGKSNIILVDYQSE